MGDLMLPRWRLFLLAERKRALTTGPSTLSTDPKCDQHFTVTLTVRCVSQKARSRATWTFPTAGHEFHEFLRMFNDVKVKNDVSDATALVSLLLVAHWLGILVHTTHVCKVPKSSIFSFFFFPPNEIFVTHKINIRAIKVAPQRKKEKRQHTRQLSYWCFLPMQNGGSLF